MCTSFSVPVVIVIVVAVVDAVVVDAIVVAVVLVLGMASVVAAVVDAVVVDAPHAAEAKPPLPPPRSLAEDDLAGRDLFPRASIVPSNIISLVQDGKDPATKTNAFYCPAPPAERRSKRSRRNNGYN